jgi:hypothetical protein
MSFRDTIRGELSIEAGGVCANPQCQAVTGPFLKGQTKSAGDGAHIVAENPDEPRGQSPLTKEERGMASNGIWLCPNCHRKVDIVQPQSYSIETLKKWKENTSIWWQQNQGRPLQVVAQQNIRPQVSRPSAASLLAAEAFLKAHQPLADGLWNLRWIQPEAFQHDVPIPNEVELQISWMSLRPKLERNWMDEWATTFHCDDEELHSHMVALVLSMGALQQPSRILLGEPRRVNFKQPDFLAQSISEYFSKLNELRDCLQKFKGSGL